MEEEGLKKTDNKLIYVGQPIEMDDEKFFKNLDKLIKQAYMNKDGIKEATKKLCPTYMEEDLSKEKAKNKKVK